MADTGRPKSIDEITLQKLEGAFANGATDVQACFLANICTATLYNYQNEHPEFIERKQALKDMIAYQAKANIKQSLLADDEKLKIETSKWYLERKNKKEFGNNVDITSDNKPLPIINIQDVQTNLGNEQDNKVEQES